MRIAAGVLMIIVGFTSLPTVSALVEMFGETMTGIFVPLCLLLLGLIVIGGIYALRRKQWRWALTGAICSVLVAVTFTITSLSTFPVPLRSGASVVGAATLGIIFTTMGVLAVIFLIKRKGEFD